MQAPSLLKQNKRSRGQALVELAILAPWIFFLFIGVVDTGFCVVAALSVQNAARAAALYVSSTNSATATACSVVRNELQSLPNYSSSSASCSSAPLIVTQTPTTPSLGNSVTVKVQYQTISLIPFPFFPSGPYQITRSATSLMRSN